MVVVCVAAFHEQMSETRANLQGTVFGVPRACDAASSLTTHDEREILDCSFSQFLEKEADLYDTAVEEFYERSSSSKCETLKHSWMRFSQLPPRLQSTAFERFHAHLPLRLRQRKVIIHEETAEAQSLRGSTSAWCCISISLTSGC